MNTEYLILMAIKLSLGSIAAFLAIWLWSKTRDSSWLMVVLGTVFFFAENVMGILQILGIPIYDMLLIDGISVLKIIMATLPFLFLSTGFIIFLIKKRWY